jgi:hypothetical protein
VLQRVFGIISESTHSPSFLILTKNFKKSNFLSQHLNNVLFALWVKRGQPEPGPVRKEKKYNALESSKALH